MERSTVSTSDSPSTFARTASETLPALQESTVSALRPLSTHLAVPVRALAFWIAVALPLAYTPLLFVGVSGSEVTALLALVALNALLFVLGHGHNQPA